MRTIVGVLVVPIEQLLTFPAPPPGQYAEQVTQVAARSSVPADDAPLDQLAGYWANAYEGKPSAAAGERLVEAIEKRTDLLPGFVDQLPVRDDVCARVRRTKDGSEYVERWLLLNCASERDRLVAAAMRTRDEKSRVEGGEELEALARADWKRAEPVLEQLAGSAHPRTRALALSLLFRHEPAEDRRRALQAIAADPHAPHRARDTAIATLGKSEWEGRDAWLLSIMADPSLLGLRDGYQGFAPVDSIVAADPDRWIPRMIALLGHADRAVHSVAANALAQFHLRAARADALRPLVPWIADGRWAADRSMHRLRLVQSVSDIGLRDAIPGLIAIVENDAEEDVLRGYAAAALAQFGAAEAAAAMRKAHGSMKTYRHLLVPAMEHLGALTAADLARGLEALLQHGPLSPIATINGQGLSPDAAVGVHVERHVRRDDVAAAAIARARELRPRNPALADALLAAIEPWDVPSAHALVMERIGNGTAEARTIAAAVWRRESIRRTMPDAVTRLAAADGARSGIAAVLSGDAAAQRRILGGTDVDAQRALLAAARLVREPLPVDLVAALFGRAKPLDRAVEAWLIADDGAAARALVQQRHPDELLILGSRLMWDPGHQTHGAFAEWEKQLLARFKKGNADELLALGHASALSAGSTVAAIEVRGDRATLTFLTESGRMKTVPLATGALRELRAFLAETRFDELGPVDTGVIDGSQFQYVHLTRGSGRRVFMNNPRHASGSPYDRLVRRMEELAENAVR